MAVYKELDVNASINKSNPFEAAKVLTANGDLFEDFFHGTDKVLCMNHIAKSQCKYHGRASVEAFVNRFALDTYEQGKYFYCVHPILQPLMYGWFPFSSLFPKSCPKIDKIL
jgi:hypothetical protein